MEIKFPKIPENARLLVYSVVVFFLSLWVGVGVIVPLAEGTNFQGPACITALSGSIAGVTGTIVGIIRYLEE